MVVLVTGGSRGIGLAVARRFARAGHSVARTSRDCMTDCDDALGLVLRWDSRSEQDVVSCVRRAVDYFGRIDVLVNNAGTSRWSGVDSDDYLRHLDALYATNVRLPMVVTREAIKHGCSSVVMVSSVMARQGVPHLSHYAASKAALESLTRSLSMELGPRIRVNAVAPGLIETRFSEAYRSDPALLEAVLGRTGLGRVGDPEEVADVVYSVATASYMTGAVVAVDGGWSAS